MNQFIKLQKTKAIAVFLAIFICGAFSQAQDITGQWNGALNIQGTNMRLVFHISKTDDGYKSTMDSPDQNAAGISVATTLFDGSTLSLNAPDLGIQYEGQFETDSIVGTFKQSGMSFPLTLKKTETEIPQEPTLSEPYRTEDAASENTGDGVEK